MSKTELIEAVAKKAGITLTAAREAVDAFTQAVTDSLQKKEEVRLVGFGTFSVASRKASTGRNPKTGAAIKIPASKLPKFKPGKGLKDAVNK